MFVWYAQTAAMPRAEFHSSSHRVAIHAAAPCPVDVKRQMIEWWGPIIHEYYGATELIGVTELDSHEWLIRPGSVGKATLGHPAYLRRSGNELPTGGIGIDLLRTAGDAV